MAGTALGLEGWAEALSIVAAPELADELARRRGASRPPRSLGVTDLVDPRTAYWRSVSPVELGPERRAVLAAGREAHVRVGHVLAEARFREVRIQREGIVGQIDLLADRPTEIKTTRRAPEGDELAGRRPSYIDQLGMYCALVGVHDGRLILVHPTEGGGLGAVVHDGRYRSLEVIWEEMRRRAEALRTALERRDPLGLPRCPWKGRGCEYEAAERCNCTGSETPLSSSIGDELESLRPNVEIAGRLTAQLASAGYAEPPAARRFRDLIYPRRAYFERTEPEPPEPAGTPAVQRSAPDPLYREIIDLLEAGPNGEMTREPSLSGIPLESVGSFRGDPVLVKVTRAWNPPNLDKLLSAQPQYFLDLALRCAAVGRSAGWLVVGYERLPPGPDRVRAFRVRIDAPPKIDAFYRARASTLESAVRERTPEALPACPGWMTDGCAYRSKCGCAAPAAAAGPTNR